MAKEWRKVWQPAGLAMTAVRTSRATGPRERAGGAAPGRGGKSGQAIIGRKTSLRDDAGALAFAGGAGLTCADGTRFSRESSLYFLLRHDASPYFGPRPSPESGASPC